MDETPLALPIPDAAKIIGLGRSKLYELIAAGELRSFTIGRRRLVAIDDLRVLIERHRAPPVAKAD